MSVCTALAAVCWLTDAHSAECTAALSGVESRTLVLLLKVGLWILVFFFERCVQYHHSAVRQRGYLQFYRKTAKLKHLPLLVHSAGIYTHILSTFPSLLENTISPITQPSHSSRVSCSIPSSGYCLSGVLHALTSVQVDLLPEMGELVTLNCP